MELQIGQFLGLSNWGKRIKNGAGIKKQNRDYKSVQKSLSSWIFLFIVDGRIFGFDFFIWCIYIMLS